MPITLFQQRMALENQHISILKDFFCKSMLLTFYYSDRKFQLQSLFIRYPIF